jgi:hypothetical protein
VTNVSNPSTLRTIGTLSQVLAWVLLVIGIVAAIALWSTLNGIAGSIAAIPGSIALVGAVPSLLFGIGNFLQFFVLGKVLQLLVDVDNSTQTMSQDLKQQAASTRA